MAKTFHAFFYGTLMHPKILKRVIQNDGSHLELCSAVLLEYTRHAVKYADYPGLVPYTQGRTLFDRDLTLEERSVRGTLVVGLTASDMAYLDYFEGNEYFRVPASVYPLSPLSNISTLDEEALVPANPPPLPSSSELPLPIEAETYVYADVNNLQAKIWSFENFVKKNAWKWIDKDPDGSEDSTEVDRRRSANGTTRS